MAKIFLAGVPKQTACDVFSLVCWHNNYTTF